MRVPLIVAALLSAVSVHAADAAHPAVLELFQSQGCSSCPPANAILNTLADRPDILALSFAVTYWDKLGWKDIFAKPAFTDRQYSYANYKNQSNVFTPQMIVNGRGILVGTVRADVDAALAAHDRAATGPEIAITSKEIALAATASPTRATVWFAQYDPRVVAVPVRAGENQGRTLPHRNIVRSLTALGTYSGRALVLARPAVAPGLSGAVFVQISDGGPIIAASKFAPHALP